MDALPRTDRVAYGDSRMVRRPDGVFGKDNALGGYEVTECFMAPEWQEMFEAAAREVIAML